MGRGMATIHLLDDDTAVTTRARFTEVWDMAVREVTDRG